MVKKNCMHRFYEWFKLDGAFYGVSYLFGLAPVRDNGIPVCRDISRLSAFFRTNNTLPLAFFMYIIISYAFEVCTSTICMVVFETFGDLYIRAMQGNKWKDVYLRSRR